MSVSFFKHKKALIDAYKDVLDESSDTDWALFTYEGKDNELKVAGTGEDGLEELESEFNSSKIMYAFIRVKDPKTSLKKFIFLHFQGEGAPATRKGACANHVRDVERFFKGAHITINARSEDDVTPEQIMEHVKKASASTYAFDKKSGGGGYDEPSQPVGSVYKRTNAGAEISSTRNESYWAKQEREEEMRKKEEERKKNEERRMYAAEIKEREKESAQRRLEWEKAREREISEKVRATKLADDTSEIRRKEKEKWDADQRAYEAESNRGRKRSESIEKAAEAAHLVQKRDTNPKTLWEQRIQEANKPLPPPQRGPLRSSDRPIDTYQSPAAPEPEYHETFDEPEAVYEPEPAAYEPEPTAAYEPQPAAVYEPEPAYNEPEPESEYNVVPDPEPQQVYDEPAQNQTSNDQYDQNQYQASNDDYQAHYDNPEDVQEPADNYAEVGDTGYRARALYDYQAADDTEITFDPDDIITNISMVDEGWWQGTAPDGKYGLFPANYVELME